MCIKDNATPKNVLVSGRRLHDFLSQITKVLSLGHTENCLIGVTCSGKRGRVDGALLLFYFLVHRPLDHQIQPPATPHEDYSRQAHEESCHPSKRVPPWTRICPGQQKTYLNIKNSAAPQTQVGGLPQSDNFLVRPYACAVQSLDTFLCVWSAARLKEK